MTNNITTTGQSPWLSIAEAADYMGIARGTLYNARSRGDGPHLRGRAGSRPRYHRDDLDAWIESDRKVRA